MGSFVMGKAVGSVWGQPIKAGRGVEKNYEGKKQAASQRYSGRVVQAGLGADRSCGDRLVCVVLGTGGRAGETDRTDRFFGDLSGAAGEFD